MGQPLQAPVNRTFTAPLGYLHQFHISSIGLQLWTDLVQCFLDLFFIGYPLSGFSSIGTNLSFLRPKGQYFIHSAPFAWSSNVKKKLNSKKMI